MAVWGSRVRVPSAPRFMRGPPAECFTWSGGFSHASGDRQPGPMLTAGCPCWEQYGGGLLPLPAYALTVGMAIDLRLRARQAATGRGVQPGSRVGVTSTRRSAPHRSSPPTGPRSRQVPQQPTLELGSEAMDFRAASTPAASSRTTSPRRSGRERTATAARCLAARAARPAPRHRQAVSSGGETSRRSVLRHASSRRARPPCGAGPTAAATALPGASFGGAPRGPASTRR